LDEFLENRRAQIWGGSAAKKEFIFRLDLD